jgi:hypothetical protein
MNTTDGPESTTGGTTGFRSAAYRLTRRFSRLPGIRRVIPQSLRTRAMQLLWAGPNEQFPDRRYMEEAILPAVVGLAPRRVLDVGLEEYSRHYAGWFGADCEYWTIDKNPRVAQYARPDRHVIGDVRDVGLYFAPASLDVVLMNGPFGYGVDTAEDQERTIDAVRRLLTPRGWIMIGWNLAADGLPVVLAGRRPGHIRDPKNLDAIRSGFEHTAPAGLPARFDFRDCSHVYDWFRSRD